MKAAIGDPPILSAEQFHAQIADAMSFPHYYGKNLDALRDVLRFDIERPIELTWFGSDLSKQTMPAEFEKIVEVCRKVAAEGADNGHPPFELPLR